MAKSFLAQFWSGLGGADDETRRVSFAGSGVLPSVFEVTEFAAAAVGAAALAVAELLRQRHGHEPSVVVDRRLASLWFGTSLRPEGWTVPPPWDPIAGDYLSAGGWIRLHTNAPPHRVAALAVLGVDADKKAVANAVSRWQPDALEAAIVAEGGCAEAMRTTAAWTVHPQGHAVAAEPLFDTTVTKADAKPQWRIPADRPLDGIRILDLTRVLAGPIATRFLAGVGAEVLRIDPPWWEEPGIVPEVTLGKRCARLDLREAAQREQFEKLLSEADVLVHGYRPDALAALGFDAEQRRALRPGLIDVSLDAYGWTGPWAGRRGFDSLVQMSTGIAEAGMRGFRRDKPTPLPVQALDHATGYLMAAAVIRGITERLRSGHATEVRTSLARIAAFLVNRPADPTASPLPSETPADLAPNLEQTTWGPARRLNSPVTIAGAPLTWGRAAAALGSSPPSWS